MLYLHKRTSNLLDTSLSRPSNFEFEFDLDFERGAAVAQNIYVVRPLTPSGGQVSTISLRDIGQVSQNMTLDL